jgi:hypothetical protein
MRAFCSLSSITTASVTMARIRSYFSKRQQQNKTEHEHVPMRITVRVPVPLDPGRPSLAQLPVDVVLLVFSFVDDIDLSMIASLCSALYEKARLVQHYTVHIHLDKPRQARNRLDVLARNGNLLLPAVRMLEVSGSTNSSTHRGQGEGEGEGEWNEDANKILTRLADMLPSMTGLRDLHWHLPKPTRRDQHWLMSPPIPRAFIDHVPTRTRLHTSVAAMDEPHDQVRAFLAQLVDSPNLFSLSVHIAFLEVHAQACRTTMDAVKQVMLSSPRLARIPMLYVGPPVHPPWGMVGGGPRPGAPYCGLGLSGGERPPALEELGVAHYPWGREPTAALRGVRVGGIYCIGYPEKGNEFQYWAEKFDWSRLRRLNDIPTPVALEMAPKLTALKEAVFEDRFDLCWDRTAFLEQIPASLELLTIPSWSSVSNKPGPITRQGGALRKLTIHCLEPLWTVDNLVTDAHLVALRNGLPRLAELALDITRDEAGNAWPYSKLDLIASFPCLRSVRLWFKLGDGDPAPPMPHVTVSTIRQLFTYLRERNRNIQRLELCSGAPVMWTFTSDPSWAMQNSIRLVCEVSLCDGNAADGYVRVTCPNFSREVNAELCRLAEETREGKRGLAEDATRLLLEVALDGPLTVDEWTAWVKLTRVRWEARQKAQQSVFKRLVSTALPWI